MAEKVSIEIVAVDLASNIIGHVTGVLKDGLASAAIAVGAAFVAGIGAAIVTLKDLTEAASEAEQSQARFNTLVDSSPLAGYKDTMIELADSLSLVTRFEDENILEAQAMLATYQTIGEDVFPQVLNTTLDLAEFMKTDATGAAETLGRAFSDISGGSLTLLYRQKLLTQAQKDTAEKMAKTGDAAGAQAYILDILDGKIGNLAETMGGTFQGRMEIFKNTLGNIREELGNKLLPVLQPVIEQLTDLAIKYAPMLAEAFDKYVMPAVISVTNAFTNFLTSLDNGTFTVQGFIDDILSGFENFGDNLATYLEDTDWEKVGTAIIDGINSIDWQGNSEKFSLTIEKIASALKDAAIKFPWGEVGAAIGDAFMSSIAGSMRIDGKQVNWEEVKNTMQADVEAFPGWEAIGIFIADEIARGFYTLAGKVRSYITSTVIPAITQPFTIVGLLVGGVLITAIGNIMVGLYTWYAPISQELSRLVAMFLQKGTAMPLQIIQAIQGMTSRVVNTIRQFIETLRAIISAAGLNFSISASIPWGALAQLANFVEQWNAIAAGANSVGGVGNKATAPNSSGGNKANTTKKHATGTGGWLTVPPGFANDTYPVSLTSGEKYAVIPNGESMSSGSPVGGIGGGLIVNLTYAPAFSTADKNEFVQNITPMLNDWYRRRLTS